MPTKTTKKQSKISALFSKLNPNTPAKKLLAFVLVFAVLGGGYYAYRSFAATSVQVKNASQLRGGTLMFTTVNGKKVAYERRLAPTRSVYSSDFNTITGSSIKICVNARQIEGKTANIEIRWNFQKESGLLENYTNGKKELALKSGWVSTTVTNTANKSTFPKTSLLVFETSPTGASRGANIGVRQIALVSATASCPK